MKLTIEIELERTDGPTLDADTVYHLLCDELVGAMVEDDESLYTVTDARGKGSAS